MSYPVFEDEKNIHKKGAVPASISIHTEMMFSSWSAWTTRTNRPSLKKCPFLRAYGPKTETGLRVESPDNSIKDIHDPPLLLATISSQGLYAAVTSALEEPLALESTLPGVPLTTVSWRHIREAHNHSRALVHEQISGSPVGGPEAERSKSRVAMSAIILGTVLVLACPA